MIKVFYVLEVMYKGKSYTFNTGGTLPALPRKDEMVELSMRMLFQIANITYKNNREYVQIDFGLKVITSDVVFESIREAFKEERQ